MRLLRYGLFLVALAAAGCSGSSDGTAAPPKPFDPAPFVGTYTGSWRNLTFGSTGTSKMDVTNDPMSKRATVVLTLTGNVFGQGTPTPQTLTGSYTETALDITATSGLFGNVSLHVDGNGSVSGQGLNVPGGRVSKVTFNGQISRTSVTLNYTAFLVAGGSANGVLQMTKP